MHTLKIKIIAHRELLIKSKFSSKVLHSWSDSLDSYTIEFCQESQNVVFT